MFEEAVNNVMKNFSTEKRVFINESHFQYEFALAISSLLKDKGCKMTLEYCPGCNNYRVDLFIQDKDKKSSAIIEMKYITAPCDATICDVTIHLKDQKGFDLRKFASWKDIEKIEKLESENKTSDGYFVLLTNAKGMIEKPDPSKDNIDLFFDLSTGEHPSEKDVDLKWNDPKGKSKTAKAHQNTPHIKNIYTFSYDNYSIENPAKGKGNNLTFYYTIIHIKKRLNDFVI